MRFRSELHDICVQFFECALSVWGIRLSLVEGMMRGSRDKLGDVQGSQGETEE